MNSELLLQVKDSFSLTGLGVLLLATAPLPALAHPDLHTIWPVRLLFPDGHEETAAASVEEVSRPGDGATAAASPQRALLLTHEGAAPVPAGTRVYLLESAIT